MALNHVLVPSIRSTLEEIVLKEYNSLTSKHHMNGHCFNGFLVPNGMNHTKSDVNNKKKCFNLHDEVSSHVEYAKLFLKKHMRDFKAFDETCDASVVLCLFGKIGSFPAALQNAANLVQKGRDIWVHYKPSEWNDDDFQERFHDMKQLVEEVGLSPSDKRKVLEDLDTCKRRGNYYLPVIIILTDVFLYCTVFLLYKFSSVRAYLHVCTLWVVNRPFIIWLTGPAFRKKQIRPLIYIFVNNKILS